MHVDVIGAAVSSLFLIVVLMLFLYLYYSLGLPLMLVGLFVICLFVLQTFEISIAPKRVVGADARS